MFDVVAAHLPDAGPHLEQTAVVVQLCVTPQARVHRRGSVAIEEPVGSGIDHGAPVGLDAARGMGGDEAPSCPSEVAGVLGGRCGGVAGRGVGGGRFVAGHIGHFWPSLAGCATTRH